MQSLHRWIGVNTHIYADYAWMLTQSLFQSIKKGKIPTSIKDLYMNQIVESNMDCWTRVICSPPNKYCTVKHGDDIRRVISAAHYAYAGFGGYVPTCFPSTLTDIDISNMMRFNVDAVVQLEKVLTEATGFKHAVIFATGFETNAIALSSIIKKEDVVFSDEMNHRSIAFAMGGIPHRREICVFKHCNWIDLTDKILAMNKQFPEERFWICIEDLYSMEGCFIDIGTFRFHLDQIRRYHKNTLVYSDAAHSFGTCDRDFQYADVMVCTFSKAVSAIGGAMLTNNESLIDDIQKNYKFIMNNLSELMCKYCIKVIPLLPTRYDRIVYYSIHMHDQLEGLQLISRAPSPVVIFMIYMPSKIIEFMRRCFDLDVCVITVGYPITGFTKGKARICINADWTRDDLFYIITVIRGVAYQLDLFYNSQRKGKNVNDALQSCKTPAVCSIDDLYSQDKESISNTYNEDKPIPNTYNEEKPSEILPRYGCGACSPRGFLGTELIHLTVETRLAELFETEAAIIYPTVEVTVSSIIQSFAFHFNRSITYTGIRLSFENHHVKYVEKEEDADIIMYTDWEKQPEKRDSQILILLFDGNERLEYECYHNRTMFLPKVYDLLIGSFSALTCGWIECGSWCVGKKNLIEHQRLSSSAYCFSAAPAPIQCSVWLYAMENYIFPLQHQKQLTLKDVQWPRKNIALDKKKRTKENVRKSTRSKKKPKVWGK